MAIRIEDLPLWAQQQAMKQINQESAKKTTWPQVAADNEPKLKNASDKYHNIKDSRGEIKFDSKKEARRFDELFLRLRAGEIRKLKLQPQFTLQESYVTPTGERVRAIKYTADFSYEEQNWDGEWKLVVEDVKSRATKTQKYIIKKKMMQEIKGITVIEV